MLSQEMTSGSVGEEMQLEVAQRAKERARIARWDLDVAVFLFVVLIIVIILLFQDISIGIVAPVAIFGLIMVWVVGWRRGRQLYRVFYRDELARLEREIRAAEEKADREKTVAKTIEETIGETVQRALRERWK
jgi:hypothetical protein